MGVFSFNEYTINKTNLLANMSLIKSRLKPGVKLCAVVKADAYGVGARNVVEILKDEVDAFAVANLDEGIEVRGCVDRIKIIVLGAINLNQIKHYENNFLSPTVSAVCEMSKLSSEAKKPLTVEFGLNTGMNRIGFSKKSEIFDAISYLSKNKKIVVSGAYSHLATKQNNVGFMYEQKARFDELVCALAGLKVIRHISNSSATWNNQDFNYDMVRVGFSMYGMNNDFEGLRGVVEIVSHVVKINHVKAGESVGYDRTFYAKRDSAIAVLPLGYYDGLSRGLSNRGRVLINGKFAPIVGRVCMDMVMVDITNIANVEIGSRAVIVGKDGDNEISLKEHADILGTSEYEILARFNNKRMNVSIIS